METLEDRLDNIHPGEVLREEFMEPLNITQYRLAMDTGLSQTRISEIVRGLRSITADTALRLGRYFGTRPQFWLNLQSAYDLEEAKNTMGAELEARVRPLRDAVPVSGPV